jgi:signal recognition particle receptor subunit alpha
VLKIGSRHSGIDILLQNVKRRFIQQFESTLKQRQYEISHSGFDTTFNRLLNSLDDVVLNKKPPQQQPQKPKSDDKIATTTPDTPTATAATTTTATTTTQLTVNTLQAVQSGQSTVSESPTSEGGKNDVNNIDSGNAAAVVDDGDDDDDIDNIEVQRLMRIKARQEQRKQNQLNAKNQTPKSPANKAKVMTKWDDAMHKSNVNKDDMAALDMSEEKGPTRTNSDLADNYGISQRDVESTIASYGAAPKIGEDYWDNDKHNGNKDEINFNIAAEEAQQGKGMWGFLQGMIGQKELTKDDLAPISKQFSERLVNKNVNPDIAEQLVESVISGLIGKKLGTFNTMYATIKASLEESLTRLLTPKKPIDVMTGVALAKAQGRPYSVVFCGVNGVGKSTSLSKIAAFFIAQGLTVGVAACDTFRSGAIEQLKTHCAALKIPLYDKGYGRDEATVAQDGIMNAKKDGLDVILIDTAGRMQGNDPLMKGLARLMNVNSPDLILFVGEALVGNDGCDQLINFNRALRENSGKAHPRLIDGIVLTKFDTIDDKVGTAINMIYSTGQPIVFVGTGQTYRDLKRPNPKLFIDALFG